MYFKGKKFFFKGICLKSGVWFKESSFIERNACTLCRGPSRVKIHGWHFPIENAGSASQSKKKLGEKISPWIYHLEISPYISTLPGQGEDILEWKFQGENPIAKVEGWIS